MRCCHFKGSCEAEKSKGKKSSTLLLMYHLAAISLQKMPGSGEGTGSPFPSSSHMTPGCAWPSCSVRAMPSSVQPCHDAPILIPHQTTSGETPQAEEVSSGSLCRLLPHGSTGAAPIHSAALWNCMALPTCCPHHAFT